MKRKQITKQILFIAAVCGFIALLVVLVLDLYPLLKQVVADSRNESKMISYIDAYGIKGVPVLIGLQILAAFIPGMSAAPISILAGLCYGVLGGTLVSGCGIIAVNTLLFAAAGHLESMFGGFIKSSRANGRLTSLLTRFQKPGTAVFVAYLVPFIPNLVLPFVFTAQKVSFKAYFVSMAGAVLPATLLYCFIGGKIASGEYTLAIIAAAVVVLAMLAALLWNKHMQSKKAAK